MKRLVLFSTMCLLPVFKMWGAASHPVTQRSDEKSALGEMVYSYQSPHEASILSMDICPRGRALALGFQNGQICLCNIDKGCQVELGEDTGPDEHRPPVEAVIFHPDKKILLSGSRDGTICFWDFAELAKTGYVQKITELKTGSTGGGVLDFSGELLVAGGCDDSSVTLWKTDKLDTIKKYCEIKKHAGVVTAVALNPNIKQVATGSDNGSVYVYHISDCNGCEKPIKLKGHTAATTLLVFNSFGKVLASGSDDATVILWDTYDLKSAKALHKITMRVSGLAFCGGYGDTVNSIAFSRDNSLMFVGCQDHRIQQFCTFTGKRLKSWGASDSVISRRSCEVVRSTKQQNKLAALIVSSHSAQEPGDYVFVWNVPNNFASLKERAVAVIQKYGLDISGLPPMIQNQVGSREDVDNTDSEPTATYGDYATMDFTSSEEPWG